VFGDKGRKMSKEIAEETGATEEEVSGIMATFLPTFESVIAEEDPKDEKQLMEIFRKDADHAREHGHGWIGRTMGRIFD
jgi:CRISPR/Cas system type I-B associated protein Csh2 (Cas7 group RAMP superfamily)